MKEFTILGFRIQVRKYHKNKTSKVRLDKFADKIKQEAINGQDNNTSKPTQSSN